MGFWVVGPISAKVAPSSQWIKPLMITALLCLGWQLAACSLASTSITAVDPDNNSLIVYSGRSETLVGPLMERFQEETGLDVRVRWGSTAELAATLLEEGSNSPADVFLAQDPGGLGAVLELLSPIPEEIRSLVDQRFQDPQGRWIGISGRARVIVYNTRALDAEDLPRDLWGFTDPQWSGRMGWAPTNASFQTMVTAMRASWGEARTRQWLERMLANNVIAYESNTPIVAAVGAREVDVGFVNHYYLYRFLAEEGDDFAARNFFLPDGGPGSLVMVSGAGLLKTSVHKENAERFLRFMLSSDAQEYFASETFEYPMVDGVEVHPELTPLSELSVVNVDLADLSDLTGTIDLLREVGVLP